MPTFLNISLWSGFDGITELDISPLLGITQVSVNWLMDARKLSARSKAATVFDALTRPKLSLVGCVSEIHVHKKLSTLACLPLQSTPQNIAWWSPHDCSFSSPTISVRKFDNNSCFS